MSKLRELTRTWLRWAAEMEDKHGQPIATGLAADMGFIEQERVMMSDKERLETLNLLRELTPRERAAMWLYHTEYASQRKGAIGFYEGLGQFEKNRIDEMLAEIKSDEVAALEARLSKMELALKMTMMANPECPLCCNGMDHSPSEDDWWKLNHRESCAWVEALAGESDE